MNNLLHHSALFFKRNASTLLTCVGGAGVVATSIMAVKATPKAMALLEQAKEEKGEELTKMETVAVAGPAYIPAILTGVSTIACIFGANVLNKRHQAALMSAYALLDNSYKEYKSKLGELYGDDVVEHVTEEIAKDKYEETDISVSEGKQLFYDDFSGRYFESTMADVIQAAYNINKKISLWSGASLNDWYAELDIPQVDYGEFLGWSAGGLMEMTWNDWLDFDYKKTLIDDDLECYIVTFDVEPLYEYEYY